MLWKRVIFFASVVVLIALTQIVIAVGVASGTTADTTPPTVPANVSALAISSSQIKVSWTASTDDIGVIGYQVFLNGWQIGTTATASFTHNINPSSSGAYSYTVSAFDAAGNISLQSSASVVNLTGQQFSASDELLSEVLSSVWKAQTFTPANSHLLTGVGVRLSGQNFPGPGDLSIRNVTAGVPNGPDLVLMTIDPTTINTGLPGSWMEFVFPTPISVIGGQQYAIVAHGSNTAGNDEIWWMRSDGSGDVYSGGEAWLSIDGGVTWTPITESTLPGVTFDLTFYELFQPLPVSITSPSNGATVSRTITVQAAASDNIGVASVNFTVDGVSKCTATVSPFTCSWDTTTATNASHTVTATAKDLANNTASASIAVMVNNLDTVLPTVSITSPAAGATVSGTITVQATASDNVGVASVTLAVDGLTLCTTASATASCSWNTMTATNAVHTITSTAKDAANNIGTNSISVTVNNPDTTPPTVSITSPANGAAVSGTITIQATASDNVGVASVRFSVDGVIKCTATVSPYSCSWDTTTATNASHTVTATAKDAANNTGTNSISVTVNNVFPSCRQRGHSGQCK